MENAKEFQVIFTTNRFMTSPDDEWSDMFPPLTLAQMRRLEELALEDNAPEVTMTCSTCTAASVCALAFDPYNTDGDCLMTK
jgi:hypothetical protein